MSTAADFLRVARSQAGNRETPPGSNRTQYGVWFGSNGVAWCAIFVSWCMSQVGRRDLRSAWCDDWMHWAKRGQKGLTWIGQYDPIRPGDLAIFDWNGGYSDHIAAVSEVGRNGEWTSIEGNWADQVTSVTRGRQNIRGFVRANWDNTPPPAPILTGDTMGRVKIIQAMLNRAMKSGLAVDGIQGPATVAAIRAFQTWANAMNDLAHNGKRLEVDGIVGPETLAALHFWFIVAANPEPAVMPLPSGNPPIKVGSPDGDEVRQVQAGLNRAQRGDLKVDGVYGPATERAVKFFQTSKRLKVDGIYGPATAAALRKAVS